ncbi:MAG: helix-turn-helix domain-containing protein [Oscillospiraceae bacterium]|nr:helix-turn-helix domain-containing protein [Oscillospiraceae bacterium]
MLAKFNAKKLHAARKENKMSQEALAEITGFSDRYIRALESGKSANPSASLVYRVSKALGVPMEDLMDDISDEDEGSPAN